MSQFPLFKNDCWPIDKSIVKPGKASHSFSMPELHLDVSVIHLLHVSLESRSCVSKIIFISVGLDSIYMTKITSLYF